MLEHDALPIANMVMAWFVVPLAVVTLAVVIIRAIRQKMQTS